MVATVATVATVAMPATAVYGSNFTVVNSGTIQGGTELFAEADIALYDAKAAGRNKVHLVGDEGYSRAA
jgi:GGDEF domain-containing protein